MKKLLLLLLCCVLLLSACAFASAEVSLTSINVGKADCHLLTLGEQVFMIDTGSAESWGMVSRALKILGIDHLNGVILTHTDKDHAGGMQALAISSIKVDAWYSSAYYTDVKGKKHPAVKAAALRGAQVQWLQAGDTIPAGAYTLQVLAPSSLDEDNENNNSVVLYLQAAEGSLLLMGDTEEGGEAELLTEGVLSPVTVLKVGHHGEGDASSKDFIRAVRPAAAVISTNTAEEPDTPSQKVLRRLDEVGSLILQTQEVDGAVRVTLTGGTPQAEYITFTPPTETSNVILADKSVAQDAVTLRNDGNVDADLSGWYIYSEKGKEIFVFPEGATLAPGASCTVGTQTTDSIVDYLWPDARVWHETKPDAAVLYNAYGQEVSKLEECEGGDFSTEKPPPSHIFYSLSLLYLGQSVQNGGTESAGGYGRTGNGVNSLNLSSGLANEGCGHRVDRLGANTGGLAVAHHFHVGNLVAIHGHANHNGLLAKALALAQILVLTQLNGSLFHRRFLGIAEEHVQQLNGLAGHVAAQTAAAALADGILPLHVRSRHEGRDGVRAIHAGCNRLHRSRLFGLIDGQIGAGVPRKQLLHQLAGIIGAAAQTNNAHSTAQSATQGTAGVAFLTVGEHLSGDHRVRITNLFAQLGQQTLRHTVAAAVLEVAFISDLLGHRRIQLLVGIGIRGNLVGGVLSTSDHGHHGRGRTGSHSTQRLADKLSSALIHFVYASIKFAARFLAAFASL